MWHRIFMAWLHVVIHLIVVMFILFASQGISMAMPAFIVLDAGLTGVAITFASGFLKISRFHLQTYTTTSLLELLQSRWLLGTFSTPGAIGLAVYAVIFMVLAIIVYKKRELDF